MLIYVDFGLISFIIIAAYLIVSIFSIDIVGLILANIFIIIAVTMILGLLYGLFYDWLNNQKTVWFASSITAPCVYIFPFLIAIGYITNSQLSIVKFIFAVIIFLIIWIALWILRIAAMKLAGISNPDEKTINKIIKPVSLCAAQVIIMILLYYLLFV